MPPRRRANKSQSVALRHFSHWPRRIGTVLLFFEGDAAGSKWSSARPETPPGRGGGGAGTWRVRVFIPGEQPGWVEVHTSVFNRLSRQASKGFKPPPHTDIHSYSPSAPSQPANYLTPQESHFRVHRAAPSSPHKRAKTSTRITCKPGYHLFYIALLNPGEDKHGLLRLSQPRPFRAPTRKLRLTSP